MRGIHWGKGTIGLQAAVPKWPHTRPFTVVYLLYQNYSYVASKYKQTICLIMQHVSAVQPSSDASSLHSISFNFSSLSFEYFRDNVPNDGRAAEHVA